MSAEINYKADKVIVTFTGIVKENEIKNTFLEVTETVRISKIKLFALDFTTITSYEIPKDYMNVLKTFTKFSSTWNSDIKVIVIATNPEIRKVLTAVINSHEEFNWQYLLYTDMETAIAANNEIDSQIQAIS